ncbi:hypothetical protein [Hydrogenophaga sp.]|jgi:hypothetical protein|uniref:hypothetical protein n=1 Tax=Hydrogenophaga sp. TaxID=1904254 RepID=UPI002736FE36|nr:hypothetical protein [Hydrogenophaga sp.]MDP3887032.1 hypothetical protein [Hydrogenophaga sp.]
MAMEKDELMLLGKMDGKLDSITAHLVRQDQRIDTLDARMEERHNSIDKRLRVVEQKAAVAGAISGSAVSIGIALAIEGAKQWLNRGGSGQ